MTIISASVTDSEPTPEEYALIALVIAQAILNSCVYYEKFKLDYDFTIE